MLSVHHFCISLIMGSQTAYIYKGLSEPRYLYQETAKGPFWFSSQASTCYYQSNQSKVEAILFSALPKDAPSKFADLSSHYPFLCWTSSREAVNTNKVFWSDSARKSNPGLPTMKRTCRPRDGCSLALIFWIKIYVYSSKIFKKKWKKSFLIFGPKSAFSKNK